MEATLNFFVCNLDSRCACCPTRYVDKYKNQPVALCEAETREKGGGKMRVFATECMYRSIIAVQFKSADATPPTDAETTDERA